ncbi:MAG: hypothetical protein GXO79_11850, partial [Chlorobi bacterium]|nr:hypothetical protein [Chlorobiota bacterium]
YLKDKNVDIQPHISPADIYVSNIHPSWEHLSADELTKLVENNYTYKYFNDGIDILISGFDSLNIVLMNQKLPSLLSAYNNKWLEETGLKVESYAAHGSAIALNHALGNTRILNQRVLLNCGLYKFDTFCTLIKNHLTIIHDNERPEWMENPGLIMPGVYELLVHPYVWDDPQSWRDENDTSNNY